MKSQDRKTMKVTSIISRSVEIPLRMIGIWPGAQFAPLCRLFWTVIFVSAQFFQYQYIIKYMYIVDLSELVEGVSGTMAFTVISIKIVIFWIKQRKFNEILTMMAVDRKTSSGIDFNVTISNATLSHNFCNFVFGFHSIFAIVYSIGVISIIRISDNKSITDISMRTSILKMSFPFHADTELFYKMMLIAQFLYYLFGAIIFGTLNSLLIVLVLHLGSQVDILCRWLTEILFSEGNGYKPRSIIIKQIIKKHQSIIIFSESIESLYSNIALILFMLDTLLICFVGFVFITSLQTANKFFVMLKFIPLYFVMNFEAFVYCFAGEYISEKSKLIGEAAYDSYWYQSHNSRIILFLMMRSQNHLTITIGKFMDLSLERFATIVKASISYISIMLAMY